MHFTLSTTQERFVAEVRGFAFQEIAPHAARWDEQEHIPRDHVQKLADAGLFGMTFPPKYGGHGRSSLEAVLAIEEVSRHCGVSGRLIVDHNFGAVGTILNFGTDEQRRRVLPAVAGGEKLISIAMTEPGAGSALTELTTTATRDGVELVVNGTKRWITGGGEREFTLLYARFDGVTGAAGIGAVLVEADRPGLRIGERIPSMGVRGLRESYLHFDNVRVPASNLVVAAGAGFKQLMSAYNGQRVAASAVCLGLAQGALDYAIGYADNRRQFGQRITDLQANQLRIAKCTLDLEAARLLVRRAAVQADTTRINRYEASIAKAYAAQMANRVTNHAIQLMGADGYSRQHPVERMARDARAFTLAGGTLEMQQLAVAAEVLRTHRSGADPTPSCHGNADQDTTT